jgi:copper homeostasis protein
LPIDCRRIGAVSQGFGRWFKEKMQKPDLTMNDVFFELCVETLEAGHAAVAGGANRIEWCSELERGGVTPRAELIGANLRSLGVPVYVLIRPRGGDFCYSHDEFDLMRRQLGEAKQAGAEGIAAGVLLADGRVDVARTGKLVELARPLKVTFHRAFDETPDLFEALEAVIETGADSLLTSGGARDVLSGANLIKALKQRAGERIHVIAGGGLRLESLVDVVRLSGVYSLHGSLTRKNGAHLPQANGNQLAADVREALRLLEREYRAAIAPTAQE